MTRSTIEGFPSDGIGVHDGGCAMEIAEDVSADGTLPDECEALYCASVATADQLEKQIRDLAKQQGRQGERIASLEGKGSVSKPENWLKRNSHWTTPSITIIALLLGTGFVVRHLTLVVDEAVDTKLAASMKDLRQLQLDVAEIRGELKRITDRAVIENAANSNPSRLAMNLGTLHEALKNAREQKEPIEEHSIAEIQSKLVNVDAGSVGYWPVVFDLISYHSILITGLTSPPKVNASEMSNITMRGFGNGIVGGYVRLSGTIDGVKFVNSWVEFDGSKPVVLKDVHFDHCVLVFVGFDFRTPSPSMQRLGRDLLASNIGKFIIRG